MSAPRPGPAGDFDYESGGQHYAQHRRTDARIAAMVERSLGDAARIINVGAGAGSYEPADRYVVAVEPSAGMRTRRPPDRVPAIDATAESLPFDDDTFDAAMATVTVHQWGDHAKGLRELRRVSRGPVVVLTFDGDALDRFWLADYVPEFMQAERGRYPSIEDIRTILGGRSTVEDVPIAIDCTDGFTEAYYARPEQFLLDEVRGSQSAWGFVDRSVEDRFVAQLSADLADGTWHARNGHLLGQPTFIGSLRLITAWPAP